MSNTIDRLYELAKQISKPTAIIGVLGLLMIALITIISVTARAVFSYPIIWGHDIASLIIVIVVASFFPTGVMLSKHVACEFLGSGLGPRWGKRLDTLGAFVTTIALGFVAWQMSVLAGQEMAYKTSTIVVRIPTGPVWWVAAIIVWISVPMQAIVTLHIASGKHRKAPQEDAL